MRLGIVGLAIVAALGCSEQQGTREVFVVKSENMSPRLNINHRVEFDMDAYTSGEPQVGTSCSSTRRTARASGAAARRANRAPAELRVKPFGGPDPESLRFIMRVVAVGGDRVSLERGRVVRNGTLERRRGLSACTIDEGCTFPRTITVPAGHVYLLGDNRPASDDSRFWGALPTAQLVGRYVRTVGTR